MNAFYNKEHILKKIMFNFTPFKDKIVFFFYNFNLTNVYLVILATTSFLAMITSEMKL
jgi:hypothetical protein